MNTKIKQRRNEYLDKLQKYFDNGDNIFPKPMSDYEFKRIITDYLLGENWYTANPVSDDQANVYIAAEIIERFRSIK